ncbi:MAG: RnfH family protein [Gammaproteobacteria bacterium]|nr:MAG: RnfH family protein [Gammaproteobacteria bacterium]
MSQERQTITVEVAYATPERQKIITCRVVPNTSLIDAVRQSGIVDLFPELDVDSSDFGIWSKIKPAKTIVQNGDRIEIYRPLLIDPKESRRRRAQKRQTKQPLHKGDKKSPPKLTGDQ